MVNLSEVVPVIADSIVKNDQESNSAEMVAPPSGKKAEVMTFWQALLLPRVFLYAMSLFCMKFAVNSMLLWLPLFL